MARFPGPEEAPQAPSLRSGTGIVIDNSYQSIDAGAQALAQGVASLGGSLDNIAKRELAKQNTADISAAEAKWLQGSIDLKNGFRDRGDYENFKDDIVASSTELKTEAANLIRDPAMRQSWLGDVELKRIGLVDQVGDQAFELKRADDLSKFETSIEGNAALISEPTTDPALRERARADVTGSIIRGIDTGLITREQAKAYKEKYLDQADTQLAQNRALLAMEVDPAGVYRDLGIPAATGGSDVGAAALLTTGGKLTITPEMATAAAKELGDNALPSDRALQKAYLSDPQMNARYTSTVIDQLTKKYNGDVSAALVAVAPEGGDALAKKWISSNHDETVLPDSVRAFYRGTMDKAAPAQVTSIPVIAEAGVDVTRYDAALIDRFEKMQSAFGDQLLVVNPDKNTAANVSDQAVTFDISKLNDEDKVRLVQTASALGFGGIGLGDGDKTMTLSFGRPRVYSGDVLKPGAPPAWAKDVAAKHAAGEIALAPVPTAGVAPEYQRLTFEQRQQLGNEAKQRMDKQALDSRSGIEVAVENAPSALASHGKYDGYLPNANDFVQAYGAADGVSRYKDFKATMEVAQQSYEMRTMSLTDIATLLEKSQPTATGDQSAYEQKRYAALVEAAAATKKAREDDPAGYTANVFPVVAEKFAAYGTSPEATAQAISAMALGQDMLGITSKQLLPKDQATKVASLFNDPTLTQEQRFAPVVATVFATNKEDQQTAILEQLKGAGIPDYVDPALDAVGRNDESAARYLIRAAMTDTKDLPQLDVKPADINEKIGDVFSQGSIGAIYYGLDGSGLGDNYARASQDAILFDRAVKLRLADGSAQTLDQAIKLTTRDFFGDVKPVKVAGNDRQAGMMITIPSNADEAMYRSGFTMLLPEVADAMHQQMDPKLAGYSKFDGSLPQAIAARDNEIKMNLANGHFANAGTDQFQFIDMDGVVITDGKGQPLVFTSADIKAAAAKAPPAIVTPPGGSQPGFGPGVIDTTDPYWGGGQ